MFVPEPAAVAATQLSAFMRFCEAETGRQFADHAAFHDFSTRDYRRFWRLFLSWADLVWDGDPEPVCTDEDVERAAFFPNLELSYVENLLRIDSPADGERTALVAHHADRPTERLTRAELRRRVRATARGLERLGVQPGDRVVAVCGNDANAVVAGLATAAVGAVFASAAPDMATPALLSRFEQLAPKLLIADLPADRVTELAEGLATLTAVVALDDLPTGDGADDAAWPRFPFNHPLFVLFTSGTTGSPKCIVHGAGGTLIEHVKEHRLHVDLRPADRLFFHTSAAWMVWNWQLTALASGSAIVVYDGPLDGPETLWRIASDEEATVFGTSPPYLQLCEESGYSPWREVALPNLRAVLSTGSVLHDRQYDWVRERVGPLPVQSISGATDIIGCFVLGNPNLPVERGTIQCRSLGLDVQALPTATTPADGATGELVCRNPFPSRPLGFFGDDGSRFHAAYFEQNPGVWTHGDLIEIDERGQARMHGRTDGVMNVRGIRVGPAEIYRALTGVTEVREALAVEWQSRLVLLVVLRPPAVLDGRLAVRIRRTIARATSPAHVPELVVAVGELPATHSGKRSERAARDALNGHAVANSGALRNPASLEAIRVAVEVAAERARTLGDEGASTGDYELSEARLLAIWESVLGVAPLRPDDDFFEVGGTSLVAVRLVQAIHDRLGVDLPLSTLIYARTPTAVAAVVRTQVAGPPPALLRARRGADLPLSTLISARTPTAMAAVIDTQSGVPPLVLLRDGEGDARPLFMVHSTWGDVLGMRPFADALRTRRPVYGLQALGLDPAEQPQTRVEDMAASYVETIRSVQPAGPYAIGGYSFGGLVAFEMARILHGQGEEVDWLGLIDANVSHAGLPTLRRWRFLAGRPLRLLRSRIAVRTRLARRRGERTPLWARLTPPAREVPPLQARVREASWEALNAYRPGAYEGSATFVYAEGRGWADLCDPLPVWRRAVRRDLVVERVPGRHDEIVMEEHVGTLAALVSARLGGGGSRSRASGRRPPHRP